jgi:hypothetical protein
MRCTTRGQVSCALRQASHKNPTRHDTKMCHSDGTTQQHSQSVLVRVSERVEMLVRRCQKHGTRNTCGQVAAWMGGREPACSHQASQRCADSSAGCTPSGPLRSSTAPAGGRRVCPCGRTGWKACKTCSEVEVEGWPCGQSETTAIQGVFTTQGAA